MKHILVVADSLESEQVAFEKALSFAQRTVASIHVAVFCHESFGVVEKSPRPELKNMVMGRYKQWWENHLYNEVIESRVSYEIIWEKHIYSWLLTHCKKHHYDMIVKTGRRSESLFHTPTDWHLFRKSHVPIYSVSSNHKSIHHVILVALDLMTKREGKRQLNHRLMEVGFQLAMQTNSSLHCCYAIEIPRLLKDMHIVDAHKQVATVKSKAKGEATELLDVYEIDDDHIHIEEGKAATVLSDLAEKLQADCVIIGSMSKGDVSGMLVGSTAEDVIQHLNRDLLVISPTH